MLQHGLVNAWLLLFLLFFPIGLEVDVAHLKFGDRFEYSPKQKLRMIYCVLLFNLFELMIEFESLIFFKNYFDFLFVLSVVYRIDALQLSATDQLQLVWGLLVFLVLYYFFLVSGRVCSTEIS